MARAKIRDVGGGQRRARARFTTSAWSLLLLTAVVLAGCNLNTPTSPNANSQLTGQTTNQQFTFNGTVTIYSSGGNLSADDTSTLTITADVRDASGNPISNLTTVLFSASLGGFVTGTTTSSAATVTTFNGIAQALFRSAGRSSGTATISVSVGQVVSSLTVLLEPEPVSGTISASFGTSGTGAVTMTGSASSSSPLDVDIGAKAIDSSANAIVGATVHFRVEEDTTSDNTSNDPVAFVGKKTTVTNAGGIAASRIRVQGPGDVIIIAELIDPNTGEIVAESNQIILVTDSAGGGPSIVLTFSDGSSQQHSFGAVVPFTEGILATVENAAGDALAGVSVRFTIVSDTAGTATFANGTTGPVTTTTNADGEAFNAITVTAAGQVVTIRAELLDSTTGLVIATSNDIVAFYD